MEKPEASFDYNKICRLCMNEEPKMTDIFSDGPETVPLPVRIMSCVSIEITAADSLPPLICNTCLHQIDNWYKFRNLCETSDALLKRLVSSYAITFDEITKVQQFGRDLKCKFLQASPPKEEIVENPTLDRSQTTDTSCKTSAFEKKQIWTNDHLDIEGDDEESEAVNPLDINDSCNNLTDVPETVDDDFSSDDSMPLLAHREKLLKEKETWENDQECAQEQTENEEIEKGANKKQRNKKTQTKGGKKRFRIRPAVPSACTLCDKVYKNAEILRQHMKSHHVTGTIECQQCQMKFTSLRSLKYHEQRNHSNLEPVPCSFCGKKFLDKKYLRIHENIHSQATQYVCQFCGRKFIMKTNLTVHISRHHTQKTNDFICQVCGKAFPFKLYLKKHFKTHTDYKPHSCSHCEARFRESTLLRKHINSIHLKLRPFLCYYCQKTFTRSLYLREHMESQHLGIPKKVECLRCGENFHNRNKLRQHECNGAPVPVQ